MSDGQARFSPSERKLDVHYDTELDILTVEGTRFTGDFFRMFTLPEGTNLTITRENGVVGTAFSSTKLNYAIAFSASSMPGQQAYIQEYERQLEIMKNALLRPGGIIHTDKLP